MIGFVLTGHGTFAEGLMGSLEMIAGPQEEFIVLPFKENEDLEGFEENMRKSVQEMKKTCDEIIIFSDLMGGSPFRTAMLVSQEIPGVEVISGTNMPILIESLGIRYTDPTAEELIEKALEAGKDGLVHAKLEIPEDDSEGDMEEEGI
ncbi:MAG: PTS sugar transporter subunit IIA [Eubacteriaceae bacterium]|jgi:PTS system N-acetylgalactosamine-specific IIA component